MYQCTGAHERNDGKTMLIVAPVRDIAQEAQAYAETYANRTCPKGYNFYGYGTLMARRESTHLSFNATNEKGRC